MLKKSRKKRPQLGFSIGVALVSIAFLLMAVRSVTPLFLPSSQTNPAATPTLPNQPVGTRLKDPVEPLAVPQIPIRVQIPVHVFNPRVGRANAPIQVYVLGHVGCRACYKALQLVKSVVEKHPTQVRLISKFAALLPLKSASIEAGLFTLLAQDEHTFWDVFSHLPAPLQEHTNAATYLTAFEESGFSLKDIRSKLASRTEIYMRQLEADLDDFNALGITALPTVVVNNVLLPAADEAGIRRILKQELEKTLF